MLNWFRRSFPKKPAVAAAPEIVRATPARPGLHFGSPDWLQKVAQDTPAPHRDLNFGSPEWLQKMGQDTPARPAHPQHIRRLVR